MNKEGLIKAKQLHKLCDFRWFSKIFVKWRTEPDCYVNQLHELFINCRVEITETQCGKTRNSLSLKKNSSNHLFSNFYCKTNAFTKFLQKKCEREFLQFPHHCEKFTVTLFRQKFRESNGLTKELIWRIFWRWQ